MRGAPVMKTYFCRLISPRPTFAQDLTGDEAKLMQAHAAYWKGWMDKGWVVAFGLVADPAGPYGIGIVEVENAADVLGLTRDDPAIRADRGFRYEVHPMPRGAIHPQGENRHNPAP